MAEESKATPDAGTAETPQRQFAVRNIYIRDVSFETTRTMDMYNKATPPNVETDMSSESRRLTDTEYEVTLSITATVKLEGETAVVVEIHQSGIFTVVEPEKARMHYVLNALCPSILFPYVREMISNMMIRGGFPAMWLAPVNFDMLYARQIQQQAQPEAAVPADGSENGGNA